MKPLYADQCILNALFHDRVKILNDEWNITMHTYDTPNGKLSNVQHTNPKIIHFTPERPWSRSAMLNKIPYYDEFWFYIKKTPWKNHKLLERIAISLLKLLPPMIRNKILHILKNNPK